jgi:hypothetical protein
LGEVLGRLSHRNHLESLGAVAELATRLKRTYQSPITFHLLPFTSLSRASGSATSKSLPCLQLDQLLLKQAIPEQHGKPAFEDLMNPLHLCVGFGVAIQNLGQTFLNNDEGV